VLRELELRTVGDPPADGVPAFALGCCVEGRRGSPLRGPRPACWDAGVVARKWFKVLIW